MSKFTVKQQRAIDAIGHNVLVSAGAGSGKTQILGARVCKLLKDGYSLDQMLILTFTKDAAFNMRKRIKQFIKDDPDLDDSLCDKVDSCDVCTYDSFNNSLLKQYGYIINLPSDFSIIDGNFVNVITNEFIHKYIEKKISEKDELTIKFLTNYTYKNSSLAESIIADLIKKEQKLPYEIDVEDFITNNTSEKFFNNAYNKLLLIHGNELKNCISYALNILREYQNIEKGNAAEKYLKKKYNELIKKLNSCCEANDLDPDYLEINTFKQLKSLASDMCFSCGSKNEEILADPNYQEIVSYADKIKRIKTSVSKVLDEEDMHEILPIYQDAVRFLLTAAKEVNNQVFAYKTEKKAYVFDDLSRMVLNLLRNHKDILEIIKSKYKIIMVDEYQDSNDIQDTLLNLLENRNLFMVGDIKQSIYAFRDGNPKLFSARYDKYKQLDAVTSEDELISGELITMNDNFRSSSTVIGAINDIFDQIMSKDFGGVKYDCDEQRLTAKNSNFADYDKTKLPKENVSILYNIEGKKDVQGNYFVEAKLVAEKILNMMSTYPEVSFDGGETFRKLKFSDFAIITEKTTNYEDISEIFKQYQIPTINRADKKIRSTESYDVLKNLIRLTAMYYSNPDDAKSYNHYLYSVSRSFICNETDEDIYKYIKQNVHAPILGILDEIKDKYSAYSIDFIYKKIFERLEITSKLKSLTNPSNELAVYQYIYSQIDNFKTLNMSFEEISEYLQAESDDDIELKVPFKEEIDDAVTLINIHKSKGLEFNIIFFMELTSQYNVKDNSSSFRVSFKKFDKYYNGISLGYPYSLIKLEQTESAPYYKVMPNQEIIDYLYKRDILEEKIRLFYVSLTRTKFQMFFVMPIGHTETPLEISDSFFKVLNNVDCSYSKEEIKKNLSLESSVSPDYSRQEDDKLFESENDSVQVVTKPLDILFTEEKIASKGEVIHASTSAVEFGDRVHKLLSYIDFKKPDLSKISGQEKRLISLFLNHKDIKDWIENCENYFTEYNYFDAENNRYNSIDCLFIFKDRAIIVDYKLKNTEDEAYKKQLLHYKENVERIFSLTNCNCYLYSLIKGELVEIF